MTKVYIMEFYTLRIIDSRSMASYILESVRTGKTAESNEERSEIS